MQKAAKSTHGVGLIELHTHSAVKTIAVKTAKEGAAVVDDRAPKSLACDDLLGRAELLGEKVLRYRVDDQYFCSANTIAHREGDLMIQGEVMVFAEAP